MSGQTEISPPMVPPPSQRSSSTTDHDRPQSQATHIYIIDLFAAAQAHVHLTVLQCMDGVDISILHGSYDVGPDLALAIHLDCLPYFSLSVFSFWTSLSSFWKSLENDVDILFQGHLPPFSLQQNMTAISAEDVNALNCFRRCHPHKGGRIKVPTHDKGDHFSEAEQASSIVSTLAETFYKSTTDLNERTIQP